MTEAGKQEKNKQSLAKLLPRFWTIHSVADFLRLVVRDFTPKFQALLAPLANWHKVYYNNYQVIRNEKRAY
jgi:hypothetical protein